MTARLHRLPVEAAAPSFPSTPWQPPQLGLSLAAAVADAAWPAGANIILCDEDRAAALTALERYAAAPRGSNLAQVAAMMGTASLGYPPPRITSEEAEGRLALYARELADIDADVLEQAFSLAVRECRFFPTIAELRACAARVPQPRRYTIAARLRRIASNAPPPVIDLVRPEQLRSLIGRFGRSLGGQRDPATSPGHSIRQEKPRE